VLCRGFDRGQLGDDAVVDSPATRHPWWGATPSHRLYTALSCCHYSSTIHSCDCMLMCDVLLDVDVDDAPCPAVVSIAGSWGRMLLSVRQQHGILGLRLVLRTTASLTY